MADPSLPEGPTMGFDNRAAGAPARLAGLHFPFRANGKRILYAYIRKNACSSFKRLIVSRSPHKEKRPDFATSLAFLQRFHAERGGGDGAGYDHTIFVVRDPAERLVSVYNNKFVQRDGHADIFANYAAVTGEDPDTASFHDFMTRYVGRPFETLDQHVRPQAENLRPAVYTDAILLDELHARMTGIVGPRMADRFFLHKINSTSRFAPAARAEAWSAPARELHDTFRADGALPPTQSLLSPALRARAREVYAADVALFEAVESRAAAPLEA
jgi:hypothetical protein